MAENKLKVYPLPILDSNMLDDSSIQFAQFYYLNVHDIKLLHVFYNRIVDEKSNPPLTIYTFLGSFEENNIPLFQELFKKLTNNNIDWNIFFKVVIYFALAPNVSVFYSLIVIFCNYTGLISWEHIISLIQLLKTDKFMDCRILNTFKKYDLNRDGNLTLNQFYNFVSKTYKVWEPVYLFRTNLIKHFFPNKSHLIILNRVKNITSIRQYRENNNGKFPNESFCSEIKRVLFDDENPHRYDYENNGLVQFSDCVVTFIHLFKETKHLPKEAPFSMKHLKKHDQLYALREIDQFYYEIWKKNLVRTGSNSIGTRLDALCSSTYSDYSTRGNTDRSTSILRPVRISYSAATKDTIPNTSLLKEASSYKGSANDHNIQQLQQQQYSLLLNKTIHNKFTGNSLVLVPTDSNVITSAMANRSMCEKQNSIFNCSNKSYSKDSKMTKASGNEEAESVVNNVEK